MKSYVLARKRVLVSDASVAHMTDAQWMMEYYSLQARERQQMALLDELIRGGRRMAASMLGLDFITRAGETEPSIVPLALLVGNPEALHRYFELADQEAKAADALANPDPSYEAMLNQLAAGDMEPLPIDIDAAVNAERNAAYQAALARHVQAPRTPEQALEDHARSSDSRVYWQDA